MQNNTKLGIGLMVLTMFIFAVQDGISLYLTSKYNVFMVVMLRYWFFAAFVMTVSARQAGGLRHAARTGQPWMQGFRGVLLAAEIIVMMFAFTKIGLVESLAIFTANPLIVAALSGPVLGEVVGWRRWLAIFMGFCGVVIILNPGAGVFSPYALIAVASSVMFAVYALLTRYVARGDSTPTSFFWTGTVGAVVMTVVGVWFLEAMTAIDYAWMAALCITGATAHFLLIKVYEVTEAAAVQPFVYLHFVFGAVIGVMVFAETLHLNVAFGCAIVIAAGLFTLWRERLQARSRH